MDGSDGALESEISASATPGGDGESTGESQVTPELEQAFEAVFNPGKAQAATKGAGEVAKQPKSGSPRQGKQGAKAPAATTTQQSRRATAQTEESELDDPELQDGEQGSETQDDQLEGATGEEIPPAKSGKSRTAAAKTGQEGDQPTLDPVLRHAAKRAGWDDASIEELWDNNPELAERTFDRMHKSFNDLSAQYARFGQQPPPQQQQPQQAPQQQRGPAILPGTKQDELLGRVFGDKFSEIQKTYGDEFVDMVLKPLQASVIEPMQQMLTFYNEQMMQSRLSEANGFFDQVKEDFGDAYGPNQADKRSQGQQAARQELAMEADKIRTGAAYHGHQMSISEALERAHLALQSPRQAEIERKRITSQVAKRERQITVRPTQRRVSPQAERQAGKSVESAQAAYTDKLAEMGIDV